MEVDVNWAQRAKEVVTDPNSEWSRWSAVMDRKLEYLDDPAISEHDKDLQYALDYELLDSAELEKSFREELAMLDFSDPM